MEHLGHQGSAQQQPKVKVFARLSPVWLLGERHRDVVHRLGALAIDAAAAKDVAAVIDGVKMVLKLFEDQAGQLGLSRLTCVGERFDPSLHDAIQQKETDEHPPGTVVTEIVAGWRLGERLVRPAMVVVAKKPSASA